MKKIFLIIIFISIIFSINARTWTYTVQLESQVPKITLSDAVLSEEGALGLYKLYGGFNSFDSANLGSLDADDISKGDITVYFKVTQVAKTRTDESISLSIKAESLVNTESDSLLSQDKGFVVSTDSPVISNIICPNVEALRVDYTNNKKNEILFHLSYSVRRPVENVSFAYFTGTWKQTGGLAPGVYISNITLSYITN